MLHEVVAIEPDTVSVFMLLYKYVRSKMWCTGAIYHQAAVSPVDLSAFGIAIRLLPWILLYPTFCLICVEYARVS